jgi:hypothetical protein
MPGEQRWDYYNFSDGNFNPLTKIDTKGCVVLPTNSSKCELISDFSEFWKYFDRNSAFTY